MKFFNCFLLLILTSACGWPGSFSKPENPETIALKIINYNLWHGLGEGFFKREELEPSSYKKQRFQKQMRRLKEAKPNILFLQEVNPVSSLPGKIAKDLEMTAIFQNINCGISFLGLGLPINLDTGIAILVRPPLKIKKVLGLKLSGPPGFCNPYFTFQYAEFRYALFALAYHPQYGSFVLVNTHFHHGVEWSDLVREKIKDWESSGVLTSSQKEQLEETIEASNVRKANELKNLFFQLKELQKHYGDLPLILAGDLNVTVSSPIYKKIIETYKLKDSTETYSSIPYTWNPEANKQNHQYTEKFGVAVPTFGKEKVKAFFIKYNRRQRRIDYVFFNSNIETLSHSLFADQPDDQGIIGSDHFGVAVSIKANP